MLIKPKRYFRGRVKREERHRLNERVQAIKVRLIDEHGKLIGIMSSREALEEAKHRQLDLVEIHEKSDPPICKIMDYGKWKFDTKKKEKHNKRNQNKTVTKEIQMRPRTDEGDIKIKLAKARKFLSQGNKVKINLRFFGREMAHKDLGFKLLKQVEERLSDVAEIELPAKMERRVLFTVISPLIGKAKPSTDKPSTAASAKPISTQTTAASAKPISTQTTAVSAKPISTQANPLKPQE